MKEVAADLWSLPGIICITTNGVVDGKGRLVMGGGCAREARERYPDVDLVWGQMTMNFGMGVYVYDVGAEHTLVSFPTKEHWRNPSEPSLIVKSAAQLVDLTNHRGWGQVNLPRPGVGLGGLKWDDVKPLIETILDDRFTAVSFPT